MKINKTTRIVGTNVILVPYREKHVLRYHEWMKSSELQSLTASEPLSLEEEYKMQKSWLEDNDSKKDPECTFIILNKEAYEKNLDEIEAMIGDTNLFFNDTECLKKAEAEIMIAEVKDRGKKFGWEAMILMLRYGIEKLNILKYEVKISLKNIKSIQMFKKLGFIEITKSNIFNEVTLAKDVTDEWIQHLVMEAENYIIDENY